MGQGTGRASTFRREARGAAEDVAQIQVLEAVLIAVIMLGAIGFVLTFTLPTSDTEPTRQGLDTNAADALSVLNDFPVDDTRYGGNMLSYAVAKALEGDPSILAERLEALLPPATKFNVYLSNGHESYTVYESGTPRGETVTATHVLEPKWQYSFVDKDASVYGSPESLGVYALPVFNSNPIDDGGVLVEVAVDFEQGGHRWTKHSYYSTVQGAKDADGDHVSSAVFGSTADGTPKPYYDRTTGTGTYDETQTTVYVTIRQDEPSGKIPAGTSLVLRFPQGLTASVQDTDDYDVAVGAVDALKGGTLEVELTRDVDKDTPLTVEFEAVDSFDRLYNYFVIDATLAGDVHGKAEIVLQDRASPTFTGVDYIDVYASVPKPMGTSAASPWTVVVADAPMEPDTTAPVTVRRVAIRQTEGIALFSGVSTSSAPSGALTVADGGATLLWDPSPAFEFSGTNMYKAFALVFEPTPSGVTTRDGSRDYLTVPVTVGEAPEEFTLDLTRRIEPGLFYGQIPPHSGDKEGYPQLPGTHEIRATPSHRDQTLSGSWTYEGGAVTLKDFLSTATVEVDPREAPVGERATIDINIENMLGNLMLRGFSVKTYTSIFPPWSITTHEPLLRELSEDTTATNRDVTQVVLRDMTGDDVLDLIVGTNEGKLVGFDLGNDGAVISGLTRTWSGQAVRALAPLEVDGEQYFVVGLAKDTGGGTASLDTLRTLDDGFNDRTEPYEFDLGAFSMTSLSAGLDLDDDGVDDYVGGDERGTTSAFDGSKLGTAGAEQEPISAGWPYEANARSALTALGTTGPVPEPTAIVTNGLESSVGIWREADYSDSTNHENTVTGALDLVKRVSVSANSDGLFGYTAAGTKVWSFPASGFQDIEAVDLDDDGTTDVVAGTWDGRVYAVNGRQAAMPWTGATIASGDAITDADFVDTNAGWTVDVQGYSMRTRDGFTTRDYANDLPVSTPGAHGVDLVTRSLGFLVGAGSTMWKTTNGGLAVDPYTSWVIQDPASTPLLPLPNLYPGGTWGTSNFLDVDFYSTSKGVVVGGPCGAYCAGFSKPIYTADGGATWKPGTIETVNGPLSLERVTWASSTTVYTVGSPAKVYRSTDSGATWSAVPPTTNTLDAWHGVDCLDATHCWVVGDGGKMYYTANGGTSWAANDTGVTADLHDVDFLDALNGIAVGEETTVLLTRDGGKNWMLTPGGGPLVADWTSVAYVASDIAYFFGGNTTTRAYGTTAAYESSAYATTKTIIDLDTDAYHSNTVVDTVEVLPTAYNNEYTYIDYEVSTDDGDHWTKVQPEDPDTLDLLGKRKYPMQSVAGGGGQIKVRLTMGVDLDYVFHTPILRWLNLTYNANFTCKVAIGLCRGLPSAPTCNAVTSVCWERWTIQVPIEGGEIMDLAETTAEYVTVGSDGAYEVRLPRVPKFWTAFLKGNVNDLDASRDVDGDGYKDVAVAVGAVNTQLGVPSLARIDEVFLLDGFTGRTLGSYQPPPYAATAEPWRVRFADVGQVDAQGNVVLAQDGVPEIVLAAADSTLAGAVDGQVVVLDAVSMAAVDRWDVLGRPDVLVVDDTDRSDGAVDDDFVVGTTANANAIPGTVYVYAAEDALSAGDWTTKAIVSPELGGRYVVNWDVPRDAPYGPYIVQTEVTWTDTDTGEIQSLYLDNYFTVTPPGSELPVSPVYTVHLVTWFEDWDVARS